RHDGLPGQARQRPLYSRDQDQRPAWRSRGDLVGRDCMGELGRVVGFGSRIMSARRVDTSTRPWAFVQRGLASVGLSGRGLVIAAPALWMTVFFLVPLAVVFGISLAVKQFGQPPYSDLVTTEGGTVQLTLHL